MKWQRHIILCYLITMTVLIHPGMVYAQAEPELSIAVSVTPLKGIVEKVTGLYANISVLLPEGVEPHAAQLPQSSVDAAVKADLLVLSGHFPWEEQLLEQVDTAYITLQDYEAFGAALSPMPGSERGGMLLSQDHPHEDENIHSYWLLPKNAIAIANATRHILGQIMAENADIWEANFIQFANDVQEFVDLVYQTDEEHHFSDLKAVVVFPAEAYVAETFGIQTVAVLEEGEDVFISGSELLAVQTALSNGSIDIILGSDIARLQQGGEFAEQLAADTNSRIVWWRVIFFSGLSDYLSIMSYNLGVLTSSLEESNENAPNAIIDYVLVGVIVFLSVVVVTETILLLQFVRKQE